MHDKPTQNASLTSATSSIDDMAARVASCVQVEQAQHGQAPSPSASSIPSAPSTPSAPSASPVSLSDDFIMKCLKANRVGDATLYNALHRGRYVYVKRWARFI